MIFTSFFLLFFLFVQPLSAETPTYDIVAHYDELSHEIEGTEALTFTNDSETPISELYLFLYPNHFAKRDADIDSAYYRKAYPVAFNPGSLKVTSIKGPAGEALPFSPLSSHDDTVMVVHLPEPVPAKTRFRFLVHFVTRLPEKFGVFGYFEDLTSIQGGWHPYLAHFENGTWSFNRPPPKSNFRIRISLKTNRHLVGSSPKAVITVQKDLQTVLMEAQNIPFYSLSIGHHFKRSEYQVGPIHLNAYSLKKNKSYAQQIEKIIEPALAFFLKHTGPLPPVDLIITEAYLHQDLIATGSNILYLNNRLFKVFPALKRFHAMRLASGLFQLLWKHKRPDEEDWVIEALARRDADGFINALYGETTSLSKWLKPLAFIPVIDQILYSSTLPLRQVYFREAVRPLVSEDIRFYNRPASENANIFWKLETLMGSLVFEPAVARYRNQDEESGPILPFRRILLESSQADMNRLIDQWLSTQTDIDFSIKDVQHKEIDGAYQTEVSIEKKGEGIEPLQIVARQKNGQEIPATWDGSTAQHRLILNTASPIKTVELDPNKLTNDPNRKDNRLPRDWKVLVDNLNLNYDFQTKELSYQAGLFFQYLYDTENWVRFLFAHEDTGDLSHIAYTRTLKKNHLLTTGLTFETLEPSRNNNFNEEAGYLSLGYTFIFPDLPLLTESARRLTNAFPVFNVSLEYNQQFTGDRYDHAFSLLLDFRRTHAFTNYHEIGTRILVGQSIGNLFENRRFSLGGTNAMRGYSPLIFEGENLSLFSLEYRFPLFYETDINLFGLAHTHTWQGAFFADAGMVGSSHDVFQPKVFQSDFGGGIRFFMDLFGVYPAIIRFDIALPIDSPIESEDKLHYYLNAGQSF